MKTECFFEFQTKMVASYFLARPINLPKEDDLKLIRGDFIGIEFPIIFQQSAGKTLSDILDTEHPWLYLISERFRKVLVQNKLTGWKIYSIKLYDKKGSEILGYHGFSITGHCGQVDYEKSKIVEERLIPTGPLVKFYKGRFINLESWDGSDFFLPKGTIGSTVNEKAAEILRKEKISNLVLEPLIDQKTRIADVLKKKNESYEKEK